MLSGCTLNPFRSEYRYLTIRLYIVFHSNLFIMLAGRNERFSTTPIFFIVGILIVRGLKEIYRFIIGDIVWLVKRILYIEHRFICVWEIQASEKSEICSVLRSPDIIVWWIDFYIPDWVAGIYFSVIIKTIPENVQTIRITGIKFKQVSKCSE